MISHKRASRLVIFTSAAQLLTIYSCDSSIKPELVCRKGLNSVLGQTEEHTLMDTLMDPSVLQAPPVRSCAYSSPSLLSLLSLSLFTQSSSIITVKHK